MIMDEIDQVREFWNGNVCGSHYGQGEFYSREYFDHIKEHRYALEPHILKLIPFSSFQGKDVLEIGTGSGTDAALIAESEANYYGIDLSPSTVMTTQKCLEAYNLKGTVRVGNIENLELPSNRFDIVYSYGVLHHTPNTKKAVDEIYRVLKSGGKAYIMLYNKSSFFYLIDVMILRRIGALFLVSAAGYSIVKNLTKEAHSLIKAFHERIKREGIRFIFDNDDFLRMNRDAPDIPIAKAYTKRQARRMFHNFTSVTIQPCLLKLSHLPLLRNIPDSIRHRLGLYIGEFLIISAER